MYYVLLFSKVIDEANRLYVTICGAMTFGLTLCIGFLFVFQVICLIKNVTTVEYHIEEMETRVNKSKKNNYLNYFYLIIESLEKTKKN